MRASLFSLLFSLIIGTGCDINRNNCVLSEAVENINIIIKYAVFDCVIYILDAYLLSSIIIVNRLGVGVGMCWYVLNVFRFRFVYLLPTEHK